MATVTTLIRIGPTDRGRTMTLDEFEEADFEEGYRYELARGVLEVSEIPGELHAVIVWALLRLIADYDRAHPRSSIGPAAVRSIGSVCPSCSRDAIPTSR